jgi:putative transposase
MNVDQRIAPDVLPTARIKEITDTRVHHGYRRVHVMLRREGHMDNVKRVYPCTERKACRCD